MISLNKKHSMDFTKILDPQSKKWQVLAKPEGPFYQSQAPIQVCKVCQVVTFSFCPKCLLTAYCSTKCWNQDKAEHSQVCGKNADYKLIKDASGCTHYVVTKNIAQGTQILVDDVPVVLPTLPEGFLEDATDKPMHALLLICFGCHKHFYPGERDVPCVGCGIGKCCHCSAVYHSQTECEILKMAFVRDFSTPTSSTRKYVDFYLDICLLRVLRSFLHGESNAFVAERYRKFTLLSTTSRFMQVTKTKKDPSHGDLYRKLLNKSVDCLPISLAYALYNREVIQQVFKSMIVFWEQHEIVPGIMSHLLFLDRHFMSQSYCSPNVAATVTFQRTNWDSELEPTWVMYTTKEINVKRDGNVRLMFDFSPSRFMTLPLRMEHLKENGFTHHCQRKSNCALRNDFSDGGSLTGSIKCLKCHRGLYTEGGLRDKDLLLNEFPPRWSTEYANNMDWKCDDCGDIQPFSLILEINRKLEKMYLDQVRYRFGSCLLIDICKFVNCYEKYLHPLNGVILRAKFDYVMAARMKHLYDCGFSRIGLPLDPYYKEKLEIGILGKKDLSMRLFPVNWNIDELTNTMTRAKYATDCMKYLECVRLKGCGTGSMENHTDFSCLKLERVLIELVNTCHRFFTQPECVNIGKEFSAVGMAAAKAIQDFNRKRVMLFGIKLSNSDPLLKWPDEMKCFGDLVDRKSEPQFLARLILQSMRISKDDFMKVNLKEKKLEENGDNDKDPTKLKTC